MDQLQVRKAEPADAASVGRLLDELGHPAPDDDVADRLRWFSRSGADHVLAAIAEAEAVGLLTLSVLPRFVITGRFAVVTTLAVPPGGDRDRIARALAGEAESLARRHGCTAIEVVTERRTDGQIDEPFGSLGYSIADEHQMRCEKPLDLPSPIRV